MNGQMTIFDGILTNICEVKPEIGSKLIFVQDGHEYPCIVENHCGYDFFWVRFTGRTPRDDNEQYGESKGWHLSLRGFKTNWRFE